MRNKILLFNYNKNAAIKQKQQMTCSLGQSDLLEEKEYGLWSNEKNIVKIKFWTFYRFTEKEITINLTFLLEQSSLFSISRE